MLFFRNRTERSFSQKFSSTILSLAALSAALSFALFNPGISDVAVAGINKAFGLGLPLDTPWWVGFFPFAFCIWMMSIAVRIWRSSVTQVRSKPFIAFRHHSLRNAVPPVLTTDDVPAALGRRVLTHMECDLTAQLATGALSDGDLQSAVANQQRVVLKLLDTLSVQTAAGVGYYGIAHIPLQVLAGRMLSPSVSPQLYELDGNRAAWKPLLAGSGSNLHVKRITAPLGGMLANVAIRVSLSFEVGLEDVRQAIAGPFEDIHIRVAQPARNIITHTGQVDAVCGEFRAALDSLHNRMASGGRVHLFLAVPMSIGFSLGRVLSSSANPDTVCYNHTAQASPRYSWGLRVNTDAPASEVVVRPAPLSGQGQP